ncbi:MAG: hypothetical protein H7039_02110 [Bryobacteraceae bacterium]|nr:hypothetical protein [Bryobacteraceae bacterium]
MEFKSYYGSTIREALQGAREELGADASILASRQVDAAEGLPGKYEVVCGVVPAMQRTIRSAATPKPEATAAAPVVRRIPAVRPESAVRQEAAPAPTLQQPELKDKPDAGARPSAFRKRIDSIREAIAPNKNKEDTVLNQMREELIVDGFGHSLAAEIVSGVKRRLRDTDAASALIRELDARTSIDANLGRNAAPRRITALVGPPGVGKTSLLVKLAVHYGLTARRPLRLITLDGSRAGGAIALESYAAGMAVPIDVLETGTSLAQTLEAHREAGMILIDTPGLSPADFAEAVEFTAVLAKHPEIDVQLVLPATMSPADLKANFDRFRPLLPSRIAVNYTDSAASCRPVIGLALRHEMPFSFAGTGPFIPEDLAEFDVTSLLCPVVNTRGERSTVSAA